MDNINTSEKIEKVFDIFELAISNGQYKINNPIDIIIAGDHNNFIGIKNNKYVDIICDKIFKNNIVEQLPFSFIEIKKDINKFLDFKFNIIYKNLFTFYGKFIEKHFNYFHSIYTWEKNMIGFIDIDTKYKKYKIINYNEIMKIKEEYKILSSKFWDNTATEEERQEYIEYNNNYEIKYKEVKPTNKKELYIINYLLRSYRYKILPYIL